MSIHVVSSCVARYVRGLLYDGTVPDRYTTCEVEGPYFLKPEEDDDGKAVRALREFEDAE